MQVHDDALIEEYTDAGAWGEETLLETFAETVDRHPNRVALVDPPNADELVGRPPERLTYAELRRSVDAVATGLRERGVGKDDIVVAQLPNTWELAMLYLAVARAGGVLSPIPVQWRRHELTHVVEVTDADTFVSVPEFKGFDHLAMARDEGMEVISLSELRELSERAPDTAALDAVEIGANELFNLQWTSGTTADAKACPMTHNNWQALPNPDACGMTEGEVILNAAPLVNMTALAVNYIPWLLTRGTFVQHHPLDLELLVEQLQDESVTSTILVPTMLNRLLKHPDVDEFDLSGVDTIITGSAAPSEWSLREFDERWGIQIINIWGQNEGTVVPSGPRTTPMERRSTEFPMLQHDRDWGFESPTLTSIDVRIVDTDGTVLTEEGEVGELTFRGPGLMGGYFEQPERTAESFDDEGYFHTGDLFRVEDDGFMSFFDRAKDVIIRGGFTISAKEVENVAIEHPAVADAAVVGMPDEDLGERICLYVVPVEGETVRLEDVTEYMGENVAIYKRPERLEVVEEIPRNPVGKVLKTDLRADLEERLAAEE